MSALCLNVSQSSTHRADYQTGWRETSYASLRLGVPGANVPAIKSPRYKERTKSPCSQPTAPPRTPPTITEGQLVFLKNTAKDSLEIVFGQVGETRFDGVGNVEFAFDVGFDFGLNSRSTTRQTGDNSARGPARSWHRSVQLARLLRGSFAVLRFVRRPSR